MLVAAVLDVFLLVHTEKVAQGHLHSPSHTRVFSRTQKSFEQTDGMHVCMQFGVIEAKFGSAKNTQSMPGVGQELTLDTLSVGSHSLGPVFSATRPLWAAAAVDDWNSYVHLGCSSRDPTVVMSLPEHSTEVELRVAAKVSVRYFEGGPPQSAVWYRRFPPLKSAFLCWQFAITRRGQSGALHSLIGFATQPACMLRLGLAHSGML